MTRIDDAKYTIIGRLHRLARLRHLSPRTEKAYVMWVRQFVRFSEMRAPETMGDIDVRKFLSHLAVERNVSASTQNQARAALVFLYRDVLQRDVPWLASVERAKKPQRLPVVLSRLEVDLVLNGLTGAASLLGVLMYGAGLRLAEAIALRSDRRQPRRM